MGEKDGHGVEGVSSGVCPPCVQEFYADYVDRMDEIRDETLGGEPT